MDNFKEKDEYCEDINEQQEKQITEIYRDREGLYLANMMPSPALRNNKAFIFLLSTALETGKNIIGSVSNKVFH